MARRITLIASLGTTPEPVWESIRRAADEGEVKVYLVYGRPLGQQPSDPFTMAAQLKERAQEKGLTVETHEVAAPEDFDGALRQFRQLLRQLEPSDEVVIDYTGGTKVMSAALVHATLTSPLESTVTLQYVGGEVRDEAGKVVREAMRLRSYSQTVASETRGQVLSSLRRYDYSGGEAVAQKLPSVGRNGFVKGMAKALRLWDSFDYDQAWQAFHEARLGEQARAFLDDQELGLLAATIRALFEALPIVRKALH